RHSPSDDQHVEGGNNRKILPDLIVMLGVTLILLAALIVWTGRVPRPIAYLLALGGAGYLVTVGSSGLQVSPRRAPYPRLLERARTIQLPIVFTAEAVERNPERVGAALLRRVDNILPVGA